MYDRLVHDSRSITCPLRVSPLSPRIAFRYVAALARVLLGVRFMFVRLVHGSRSVRCSLRACPLSPRLAFRDVSASCGRFGPRSVLDMAHMKTQL